MMMIGDADDDNRGQVKTDKSSLPVETCWNWREPCSPDREREKIEIVRIIIVDTSLVICKDNNANITLMLKVYTFLIDV